MVFFFQRVILHFLVTPSNKNQFFYFKKSDFSIFSRFSFFSFRLASSFLTVDSIINICYEYKIVIRPAISRSLLKFHFMWKDTVY